MQIVLPLGSARLGEEYFYQSVPFCIIDAVYSIGVRYPSVQRVVSRYCERFGLQRIHSDRHVLPAPEHQESVSVFCRKAETLGAERMAVEIFRNRQRTSTR